MRIFHQGRDILTGSGMSNGNVPSTKKEEGMPCLNKDLDIGKKVKHLGKTGTFVWLKALLCTGFVHKVYWSLPCLRFFFFWSKRLFLVYVSPIQILPILRHPDSLLCVFHVFTFHIVLVQSKSSEKK